MSDKIVISVQGDIDEVFRQAQAAAAKAGGILIGDSKAGTLSGNTPLGAIKGAYAVAGQHVTLTISEKPWLVPVSTIERELRAYFA